MKVERPSEDAGFSLLEVVVAMVVFAVLVSAVLGVVLNVFDTTRSNTHRVAAANLATKQLESTRSMSALDIPDGATSRTETVGATEFTVTQTANYVVSGSDTSICQGTGEQLAYKLINVTVTWPRMGSVKPVRADTLKALGLGDAGLDSAKGSLAIAVAGATGAPVAGVTVTLAPGGASRVTGSDGCAVFVGLAPGDYVAAAGQAGYVGHTNTRAVQLTQGVQAGRITRGQLLYDGERTLDIRWDAPAGYLPPSNLPVRYRSSYVDDGAALRPCGTVALGDACIDVVPGTVQHLFPAIYELSAGSCTGEGTGSVDVDLVAKNGAVDLPLAGVRVSVVNGGGQPMQNQPVTLTCTSGETYDVVTDGTGQRLLALPFGTWSFSTTGLTPQDVTVSPGNGVRDVVLRKSSGEGGGG